MYGVTYYFKKYVSLVPQLGFYTMKCVRALLLTELQVKMRVCKHGCEVSLFVRNISKLSQHAKKIQDKMLRQSKELCLLR